MSHPALAPLGAAIVLALALPAHAQTAPAGATDLDAVQVRGEYIPEPMQHTPQVAS